MTSQNWKERFDELCQITVDGKCKYWRPEAFGYDKDDKEAPLDKFFPEEIKSFISQERSLLLEELAETLERDIEDIENNLNMELASEHTKGHIHGLKRALYLLSLIKNKINDKSL